MNDSALLPAWPLMGDNDEWAAGKRWEFRNNQQET
jgi:hypothetical protein